MDPLIALAIQELPSVIDRFKELFHQSNPDAALPTSEMVLTAYESAFASSRSRDAAWLSAHPE